MKKEEEFALEAMNAALVVVYIGMESDTLLRKGRGSAVDARC